MKKLTMEWNKKIKDQLLDFEVAPPDDCWKAIHRELQNEKSIPIVSPYAKALLWIKYSAAAVVVGLILITAINEPFRNSMQQAIMGPSIKAAAIDSTPILRKDSISSTDSIH